jgi:two-component system, response regulator
MLTTSVEDNDIVSSYALGANAYVRKPVAFEEFLAETARLGQFWLHTNVQAPPDRAVPR